MLGLGGSVATPRNGITAPVLIVSSLDELTQRAADAKGKIVLLDVPLHRLCSPTRRNSHRGPAPSAAARGAVAPDPVGRLGSIRNPHTGCCATTPRTARRIPAAALSVEDAMMLHRIQDRGERVVVTPG